ncbi:MAG: hypothetical protein RMJ53_06230 [Chitinophagales bacterium]|nr:hypothetical protein [Chitinophagales bacterium]
MHRSTIIMQKFFETPAQDIDSWVLGVVPIHRDETMIGILSQPLVGMNVTEAFVTAVID